ncbi:MAG: GTP-binding protein [Candidatus Blackburnbacteria bacterium]|nr:GTP-binding protein [Candidatus Blackburnbacteria bacterium]
MALQTRPPIVAVLGHVDHGKTSLLDRIRNTSVASREAGGITQSIGAWQVEIPRKDARDDFARKITFIDTPGHAAFNAMRSRGAKVADLAILVVAADDAIMPQTKESLAYLREASTPFIVAITKVDLPTAQPELVKGQLAQEGVFLEGRGGEVTAVEVSSVTGQGIEELLELITLTADLQEINADSEGPVEAVVIETERDAKRGPVVSCIIKNGTLRIGSELVSSEMGNGGKKVKVRGLFDENNRSVKEAGPGTPVEVLGFDQLPSVGSILTNGQLAPAPSLVPVTHHPSPITRKKEGFWIILKADTAGSLEAIQGQLGAKVGITTAAVGEISDSDIALAFSTRSPIVGFNVKASKDIQKMADEENVKVYTYRIIYELLSDVEKWQKEFEELQSEKIVGKAQIIAQFPHDKESRIAGCRLLEGRITKTDKLRVMREDHTLGTVRTSSLKQQKQELDKVDQGEFGIYFQPQLDFRIGDSIEAFQPPKSPTS